MKVKILSRKLLEEYKSKGLSYKAMEDMFNGIRIIPPEELSQLIKSGMSYEQIALFYRTNENEEPLTRQRISQIVNYYSNDYPDLYKKNDKPDKKRLENFLNLNLSLKKIAKSEGISVEKLNDYLAEYGLKHVNISEKLTREKLWDMFVVKKMSDGKIAKEVHASRPYIFKLREKYGITEADRTPLKAILTENLFRYLYVEKRLSLEQIGILFGTGVMKIIEVRKLYTSIPKLRTPGVSEELFESVKQELIEKGVIRG